MVAIATQSMGLSSALSGGGVRAGLSGPAGSSVADYFVKVYAVVVGTAKAAPPPAKPQVATGADAPAEGVAAGFARLETKVESCASKEEVAEVRAEMRTRISHEDLAKFKANLDITSKDFATKGDVGQMRGEIAEVNAKVETLRDDFANFKAEVLARFAGFDERFNAILGYFKILIFLVGSTFLTVFGTIFGLFITWLIGGPEALKSIAQGVMKTVLTATGMG